RAISGPLGCCWSARKVARSIMDLGDKWVAEKMLAVNWRRQSTVTNGNFVPLRPVPRNVNSRLRVLVVIPQLLLAACAGGSPAAPEQPRATGEVRSVTIAPSDRAVAVGGQIQLRAIVDADPGVDTTVRWSADSSDVGWVLRNGLVQACY